MVKVLILEGSDCSGKTTLVGRLKERLNYEVVKGSSFEHSQCTNKELFEKFDEMTEYENVIFDRFIYSNEVYATLYNDFTLLTDNQRREIEGKILDRAIIIYLEADMDTLVERMNSRGDDYVKVDRLPVIKEKYNESMSKVEGIEVLRFNTTYITTDEIVNVIAEKLGDK